jgi:hypothetical protein
MSDLKSKLPDFQELSSMACKLFSGLKKSVGEIISDYKEKRAEPEIKEKPAAEAKKTKSKPAKKAE